MRILTLPLYQLIFLSLIAGCTVSKTTKTFQSVPYAPVKEGYVWHYNTGNEARYRESITASPVTFLGNTYLPRIQKYNDNSRDTVYFRNHEGACYYFDEEAGEETLVIPRKKKEGRSWKSGDGQWHYRIIATDTTVSPPGNTYSGLLAIKARHTGDSSATHHPAVFYDFYHRKKGLVASISNGDYYIYLTKLTTQ